MVVAIKQIAKGAETEQKLPHSQEFSSPASRQDLKPERVDNFNSNIVNHAEGVGYQMELRIVLLELEEYEFDFINCNRVLELGDYSVAVLLQLHQILDELFPGSFAQLVIREQIHEIALF